jgi:HK97 family phage portal protein
VAMKPVQWARRMLGVARRAITSLPWSHGGDSVSAVNSSAALSLIPYFACVRLLSEQISSLPLSVYQETSKQPVKVKQSLFDRPSAVGTTDRWVKQYVASLAMRGNTYGLIVARDALGFATQVELLHPDEVHVDESMPTLPRYYWRGQEVPRESMHHTAWFVEPGRVKGLSPIAQFARSIGIGLEATNYGATWFEHGGTPPGTFQNKQRTLTTDQAEAVSQRLDAAIKRRKPLVYGADWAYESLQVSPEESQFIQTMKLNATQMATIYGIPPELVGGESGGSLTYDNPVMDGLALYRMTIRPWLELLEDNFDLLLPDGQYAEFNPDALLRGDTKSRYEAHQIALTARFMTINEVRKLEGLPPIDGGDTIQPVQAPVREDRYTLPPAPMSPPVHQLLGHQ